MGEYRSRLGSFIDNETAAWKTHLEFRTQLKARDKRMNEQMKQVLDREYDLRMFHHKKQLMLTDFFKNTESLLVNIDKAIIQMLDKSGEENTALHNESF